MMNISDLGRGQLYGCVKLDFDGAVKGTNGHASYGGVFWDHDGIWLLGYAGRLGVCSITVAELSALRAGLELAWREGWRNLEVSVDSLVVVEAVNGKCGVGWIAQVVLDDVKDLLNREWHVRVTHCYREGNRVADALANFGQHLATDFEEFLSSPTGIQDLLWKDLRGVAVPRAVPV